MSACHMSCRRSSCCMMNALANVRHARNPEPSDCWTSPVYWSTKATKNQRKPVPGRPHNRSDFIGAEFSIPDAFK